MTTLSPLQPSEIDIIVKMMQEFYVIDNYPLDVAISKKLFEEFISNEELGKSWLIKSNKKMVGYLILTFIFSFEYRGKIAFLDELYIKVGFRGKGIGKETIQLLKNEIKTLNLNLVYLEVENHNAKAQKLYLANGFEFHNRKVMKLKP